MTSYKIKPLAIMGLERGADMISAVLVGNVIKKCRKSKGMTQEVLSGLADLDRTHYSKIERGLRNPTIDTLFKIAGALDIAPHDLMIEIEKAVNEEQER